MDIRRFCVFAFHLAFFQQVAFSKTSWRSGLIPEKDDINCTCNQWRALSSPIKKWMTKELTDTGLDFDGPIQCKYAIETTRKKCEDGGFSDRSLPPQPTEVTDACRSGEVKVERRYFLPRKRCFVEFLDYKITAHSQCRDNLQSVFSVCYRREQKSLGYSYYCKGDVIACVNQSHVTSPRFQWAYTLAEDNCPVSACTDGANVGVRKYFRQCVRTLRDDNVISDAMVMKNNSLCSSDLASNYYIVKCPNLTNCDGPAPATPRKTNTDATSSGSTKTTFSHHNTADNDASPMGPFVGAMGRHPTFQSRPTASISYSTITSSSDDVIARSSISWHLFVTLMSFVGIIFLLLIVCLTAALCYIVFCRGNKRASNFTEVREGARDTLGRVSQHINATLRRSRKTKQNGETDLDSGAIRPPNLLLDNNDNIDRGSASASRDGDSPYWVVKDGRQSVTSYDRDDIIHRNPPLLMRSFSPVESTSTFTAVSATTESERDVTETYVTSSAQVHGSASSAPSTSGNVYQSDSDIVRRLCPPPPPLPARNKLRPSSNSDFSSQSSSEGLRKSISDSSGLATADDEHVYDNARGMTSSCGDVDHDKLSFDEILNDLTSLRRNLSFITSTTSEQLLKELSDMKARKGESSAKGVVTSSTMTSGQERQYEVIKEFPKREKRNKGVEYSLPSPSLHKILHQKSEGTLPHICTVTSSMTRSPLPSTLHPRAKRFGIIRGNENPIPHKIFIDTTKSSTRLESLASAPIREKSAPANNPEPNPRESAPAWKRTHKVLRPMDRKRDAVVHFEGGRVAHTLLPTIYDVTSCDDVTNTSRTLPSDSTLDRRRRHSHEHLAASPESRISRRASQESPREAASKRRAVSDYASSSVAQSAAAGGSNVE